MEGINFGRIYVTSRYLSGEGDEKQEHEDRRSPFRDFNPGSSRHEAGAATRPR